MFSLCIHDVTDRTVADAHKTSGFWDDGRGEDELSPEEIQMVRDFQV